MTTQPLRIYHNPHCSKSRSACAILDGLGLQAQVVDYLKHPPTREELVHLLDLLGMKPLQLIRQGEPVFKEHYAGQELDDQGWLVALLTHHELMERPIVVAEGRAMIARPPEGLEAWLKA